ncbi:MAG: lytic transglycosylase domain-containing protein [Betaproteobacteria bacterium]|nr:lytic transglycosylase domain-containing protein [Betaproteobacteria bacterium]
MKKLALIVAIVTGGAIAWKISRDGVSSVFDSVSDTAESVGGTLEDITVSIQRQIFGTKYDEIINQSAEANGIPPNVLYKLLWTESRFRQDIIDGRTKSPTGALGIAQFMPTTAVQEMGSVEAALDPSRAIPAAARYLSKLRAQFGGDLTKAVAAYNWGQGNVKRKGLASAPKETVNYVLSVLGINLKE